MNLKEYIREAFEYAYWGTHRYFAVAETCTDEQLHQPQGHSWGDVFSLLVHMHSSEWVWLQRWKGVSPKAHLKNDDFPTLADLKRRWSALEAEIFAFLDEQTEQGLERVVEYSNFSGETFRVPLWQMLMHVPNHATHHRGELAAMFALMKVPHPEEEVIQYFLNKSGQKKF